MRTRDILRMARRDGKAAGIGAAGWALDFGRMTSAQERETAERILRGIDDCDPAILDGFNVPNLSGEYADDPTPRSLAEDYGVADDDSRAEWLIDELSTAWENAASESFWRKLAEDCRDVLTLAEYRAVTR